MIEDSIQGARCVAVGPALRIPETLVPSELRTPSRGLGKETGGWDDEPCPIIFPSQGDVSSFGMSGQSTCHRSWQPANRRLEPYLLSSNVHVPRSLPLMSLIRCRTQCYPTFRALALVRCAVIALCTINTGSLASLILSRSSVLSHHHSSLPPVQIVPRPTRTRNG